MADDTEGRTKSEIRRELIDSVETRAAAQQDVRLGGLLGAGRRGRC
jgi:hypothetical protein